MTAKIKPANNAMKIKGWLPIKERVWKKAASKVPTVDLALSFGGEAITRGIVSRMEVREGIIGLPLAAVSQ